MPRYVNSDNRGFCKISDGSLVTTQQNIDFLREYDIEHDNGVAIYLASPELNRVSSGFNIKFAFTPKHVLNPHHIQYFHPGGHPYAAKVHADYALRKRNEPLWLWIVLKAAGSSVVRTILHRRLKSAVFRALEKKGYGRAGNGKDGLEPINGTLILTLHDIILAVNQPEEQLGQAVANVLHEQNCRKQRSTSTERRRPSYESNRS